MFLPEYSITQKILKNIAQIEQCKAIIETLPILPHWEKLLQKEARINTIDSSLMFYGVGIPPEEIKKYVDGLADRTYKDVKNIDDAFKFVTSDTMQLELTEDSIKHIHSLLTQGSASSGTYRKRQKEGFTHPDEILAKAVEMIDWYNSLDARETHPILLAGLIKGRIEHVMLFEQTNFIVSNFTSRYVLNQRGYSLNHYYCLEDYYIKARREYEQKILSIVSTGEEEYTEWLEYFTDGLCTDYANLKEKVVLLSRDTKVAKSSGRNKLTARQSRIVEYLQDYGILQNKDFVRVFPDTSEDSILRDLKTLITAGIVVKEGSTKSSRYELA